MGLCPCVKMVSMTEAEIIGVLAHGLQYIWASPHDRGATKIGENEMKDYQATGWVKSFTEVNAWIGQAKRATPMHLHAAYRSYIRFEAGGYIWGWVLR